MRLSSRRAVVAVLLAGSITACGAYSRNPSAAPEPMAPSAGAMQPQYAQEAPAAPPGAATPPIDVAPAEPQGTESYTEYGVNPVSDPAKDRFYTFAIDVDTASYAIARRKLNEGGLPPYQAVREEE